MLNEFELHPDRLATTDEQGRRVFIYPADVRGQWRKWRTRVQFVLIIFFLALPWLRINGRQALLLNVASREFDVFGLSLRAHNAPLMFFVFAAGAFGLLFATAAWGRVWCGWACPQTVFIDGVFRRIERWIEGPALTRRQMARGPWTAKRVYKWAIKWILYVFASLIITHSFLAVFVGSENLITMVTSDPRENWSSFLFILISTGIILFDFAWFREQFCIIACPYGRLQSVIMDDHSTVVAYNTARGEPRATPQAKALAKTHGSQLGDCVNCYRCVQVCPTGIDIRRGTQLECIACTACIDACDEVMTKTKKPTGLISYTSQRAISGKTRRVLRPRALVYLGATVLALAGLAFALSRVSAIDIQVLRAKEAPYTVQHQQNAPAIVMNHFQLEISNQTGSLHELDFETDSEGLTLVTAFKPFPITPGKTARADIFIRFSQDILKNGEFKARLLIRDRSHGITDTMTTTKEITLVGPYN